VFEEGSLILFTPFHFKNGLPAQDKFFIVLKTLDDSIIIASLPTSKNKVPNFLQQTHGCINDDVNCFNCYLFDKNIVICDTGFSFNLTTFVYGSDLDDYELAILNSLYVTEGKDYEIKGKLLPHEFQALVYCLKNSASVKKRIQRLL
jgi:hypothetical protein